MKKRIWCGVRSTVLLAILILAGPAATVQAQSKTGTTVGQFLLIEPSARAAAMGNAGATMFDGAMAAYFNVGSLGHLAHSDVQFSHMPWLADITYNHASAAVKLSAAHTLLLSITHLNSGEIDVRTVENPLGTGERYSVTNTAFDLGYAMRITDRVAAGLKIGYVQETIWHSSMNALALSFGTLYRLPQGAYLGASVSNFGTRGSFGGRDLRIRYNPEPDKHGGNDNLPGELYTEEWPLPIVFRVGIGYPYRIDPTNQITFMVDAMHPSDNTESVSFGAEWQFMDVLAIRGGYQQMFKQDSEEGLTLGAGIQYAMYGYGLRFDYAWADHGRLGSSQRFTLGFSF